MRQIILLLGFFLFVEYAHAAPPRCKNVDINGTQFQDCQRDDANCLSLAHEQIQNPSNEWNGCAWPAMITKSYLSIPNVGISFDTHVLIVPSYRDSERMDITISIEQPDHSYRTVVKKDVPIIIEDNIPQAAVDVWSLVEPLGVATVEMTEKGGKKEASHSYK